MCNRGMVKVLHCITCCIEWKGEGLPGPEGLCVTLRQGIAPNNASVGPWEGVQGFTGLLPLFDPILYAKSGLTPGYRSWELEWVPKHHKWG